ncbi:Oxidation resistance protein 1-like protein [Drosera capensis]
MGRESSLRSKAVHFVSDLTTVLLNPISDKQPTNNSPRSHLHTNDEGVESDRKEEETGEEGLADGPDTSSFTAFLYSLLSPSGSPSGSGAEENDGHEGDRRGFFSRGKRSLGEVDDNASETIEHGNGGLEKKDDVDKENDNEKDGEVDEEGGPGIVEAKHEELLSVELPEMSEPSRLLLEDSRSSLYVSLPSLAKGRKWVLLYSTWRHGISLSTLYRRSQICAGLSLLVVGDRKGATFGGLVETPLTPTKSRKYQGTNNTFVFTDLSGSPVVYRPTGTNRYFTLCTADFLALGGGGHFALYLDSDLLNGSSSASDTYGNPCLANSPDFEVKDLWGFVYASKYDEVLALSHAETHGVYGW